MGRNGFKEEVGLGRVSPSSPEPRDLALPPFRAPQTQSAATAPPSRSSDEIRQNGAQRSERSLPKVHGQITLKVMHVTTLLFLLICARNGNS